MLLFLLTGMLGYFASPSLATPHHVYRIHADSVFIDQVNQVWQMNHIVSKGQTLYTLHKKYKIPIEYLKKSNELSSDLLSIGDHVTIPLYKHRLRFVGQPADTLKEQVPIYYKVKKGQTLLSLAVKTFGTTMQAIRQLNKLKKDPLTPGQVLHVGWCEMQVMPIKKNNQIPLIYQDEDKQNQQIFWQTKKDKSSIKTSGVAFWDRSMKVNASNKLLGLFKNDLGCKFIKITNPLTRRSVHIKSLSELPYNAKTKGCIIQITPSVADALGAIDSRFYVEIEYIY